METTMAKVIDIVTGLEVVIDAIQKMEKHSTDLIKQLDHLLPSHNTVKAMLLKVGFSSETTNEDNLRLLIDHHTALVAENTKLHATINSREALMKQLREVVMKDAD
jgi:hypothetical protein